MVHRIRLIASLAMLVLVAACSGSVPGPTGSANPSPIAVQSPAPSAAPTASPAASPSAPSPSSAPSDVPPAVTPSPKPVAFSAAEKRLVEQIRVDARIACVPRRTDLPLHAVAGVECHIGTALVDRVGAYSLGASASAIDAYLARLATAHVTPRTGDCGAGNPGDHSWPAYLPDETGDGTAGYREERSGCFLDENGIANVRLTCYGDIYMGVLGKTADLKALYAWTWRIAAGEDTHRDPPGLCAAPD
jgi:hypothetical protein